MPKKKKAMFPRLNVNLARSSSSAEPPTAGTVAVTFNASNGTVTLPANADVVVNKSKMNILFTLTAQNLPQGAAAVIQGIEFAKANEPSGTYTASAVFEDPSTFTDQAGQSHTVYGKWQAGQSRLKVVDDDNVAAGGSEQDYGYRVWVKLTSGSSTQYYPSPDPQVKNEPTTGG